MAASAPMRFLVSLLLLGAILFAALFVPVEGQNGWHRAHRDGWPRAAAQTAAAAASASFRWAARLAEGIGERTRAREDARDGAIGAQPGHKAAPPQRRRAMARVQAQRPSPAAPLSPAAQPPAPFAPPPAPTSSAAAKAPAAPSHDGIVPAPTKEQLDGDDRHALEKLIAGHGGR